VQRVNSVAGTTDALGNVGYSGAENNATAEGVTTLYVGLVASIQLGAAGKTTKNVNLPGDATSKPVWNIFIPASVTTLYDIRDRDIIVDDEQYRYEVGANYWTGLGYQLSTVRQES
jgi:hypothetical protein